MIVGTFSRAPKSMKFTQKNVKRQKWCPSTRKVDHKKEFENKNYRKVHYCTKRCTHPDPHPDLVRSGAFDMLSGRYGLRPYEVGCVVIEPKVLTTPYVVIERENREREEQERKEREAKEAVLDAFIGDFASTAYIDKGKGKIKGKGRKRKLFEDTVDAQLKRPLKKLRM